MIPFLPESWGIWSSDQPEPLAYSMNVKKILMLGGDALKWYDEENGEVERIYSHRQYMSVTICLDTLVSISALKQL